MLIALAEATELEAGQFTALAAAERLDTHGTVRVTAPEMLGHHVILAAIGDLKARRPDLRVELTLQTGAAPLIDGQTDIALLPSPPESGDFTFTEIHSVSWGFYAHRDYLSRAGAPQDVAALTTHDLIGVETPSATFEFLSALGLPPGAPAYRFRSDSFTAQFAAVRAGLGIAQCQNRLAAGYPELVRVVPEFDPRLPAYLAMREWLRGVARVRLVHDAILEAMKRHVAQV